MEYDKNKINEIAVKIIKEVVKEKKYPNLTEGVKENTTEDMTVEQVKRVLEEVNKKVFTFIYEKREDKNFSFDIASLEEVLSGKEYKKNGNKKILSKKSKEDKINEKISNYITERKDNPLELAKAASYILGEGTPEGFGVESFKIASELVSFYIEEDNDKTASKLLDLMHKSKRILTGQDKELEKNLASKKVAIASIIERLTKKAFMEDIGVGNAIMKTLAPLKKLKNESEETQEALRNSGFTKGQFVKNYISGNVLGEMFSQKI